MDVGGGEGVFLAAVAQRWPHLKLMLFDLPEVARRAQARLSRAGLARPRHGRGAATSPPMRCPPVPM